MAGGNCRRYSGSNSGLHAYRRTGRGQSIAPALFLRESSRGRRNIDRAADDGKRDDRDTTTITTRSLSRVSEPPRALFGQQYADPPRYRHPGGPFWAPTACRRRRRRRIWLPGPSIRRECEKGMTERSAGRAEGGREGGRHRARENKIAARTKSVRETEISCERVCSVRSNLIIRTS